MIRKTILRKLAVKLLVRILYEVTGLGQQHD
jgi:hypothetical protein